MRTNAFLVSSLLLAAHSGPAGGVIVAVHAVAAEVDDKGGSWMLLVPAGQNYGRDGRGPFDAGDAAAMQAIIDATKLRAGKTDLMVDYDHQSVFAAVPGVGGRAEASGWISDFKVEADGIHAHVQWTAAAATAIRNREYRYLSPVYQHDKAGKIIAIVSAGLVNVPNFDLTAVAASAQLDPNGGTMLEELAAALGLAKTATKEEVLAAANAQHARFTSLVAVAKALGLKDDAGEAEILTAVNKAGTTAATPDPTKFVPIEQLAAMQVQLNTLSTGIATDKAEAAVNKAIADGKLVPALKEWGLSLHKADPAKFETFVAGAPKLLDQQLPAQRRDPVEPSASEADVAVMRQMGIAEKDFLATRKQETA